MSKSHRDYLRFRLSASSAVCRGLLIITVITPLTAKPSATKMPELAGERGTTEMQMRQRDVAAPDKIHG